MNPRVEKCYPVPGAWNCKGDEIVDVEMGVPCSAYGGEETCVQGFVEET